VQDALTTLAEHVAEADVVPRNSLEILLDFANSDKIPPSLRISAAAAAAPYEFPKKASVPPAQYVTHLIDVPDFDTVEEAEDFLKQLSRRVARKELDFQSTEEVAARIQAWIDSRRRGEDLAIKRIAQDVHPGNQVIRIEGGMPTMPGCENLIMPHQLNANGSGLLEHEPAVQSNGHDAPASTPDTAQAPGPTPDTGAK
jgi:hypothetical protein